MSDTNDRHTPAWFFAQCQARFGPFDADVAATEANTLCPFYLSPADDALTCIWPGNRAWCNPPYGPTGSIPKWIAKAREERDQRGMRTLMLLPADTSTAWYQDLVQNELCELVPFRLAFGSPDGSTKGNSAKFGSLLAWIAPQIKRPGRVRL